MAQKISKLLKGELTLALFFVAFGLCLICIPNQTVNILCKIVFGILMIGTGLYHIIIYIAEKKSSTILDLLTGVIVLVLGGFLFYNPQVVIKLLPILLGALVLVDSIWKLRGAVRLKKRKKSSWKIFLINSVIFIALGIINILNLFSKLTTTVLFSGIVFTANGVLDLLCFILLWRGMKEPAASEENQMQEKTEADEKIEETQEITETKTEETESIEEWKD